MFENCHEIYSTLLAMPTKRAKEMKTHEKKERRRRRAPRMYQLLSLSEQWGQEQTVTFQKYLYWGPPLFPLLSFFWSSSSSNALIPRLYCAVPCSLPRHAHFSFLLLVYPFSLNQSRGDGSTRILGYIEQVMKNVSVISLPRRLNRCPINASPLLVCFFCLFLLSKDRGSLNRQCQDLAGPLLTYGHWCL